MKMSLPSTLSQIQQIEVRGKITLSESPPVFFPTLNITYVVHDDLSTCLREWAILRNEAILFPYT